MENLWRIFGESLENLWRILAGTMSVETAKRIFQYANESIWSWRSGWRKGGLVSPSSVWAPCASFSRKRWKCPRRQFSWKMAPDRRLEHGCVCFEIPAVIRVRNRRQPMGDERRLSDSWRWKMPIRAPDGGGATSAPPLRFPPLDPLDSNSP